jgi:hypothetical protein
MRPDRRGPDRAVADPEPALGPDQLRGGAARRLSHCLDQATHVDRLLEYRGDPKVSGEAAQLFVDDTRAENDGHAWSDAMQGREQVRGDHVVRAGDDHVGRPRAECLDPEADGGDRLHLVPDTREDLKVEVTQARVIFDDENTEAARRHHPGHLRTAYTGGAKPQQSGQRRKGTSGGDGLMGFYLRRAFRLGPLRLNLSKRGLGASVGEPGARVGVDATGTPYVHSGRGGVYYRGRSFGWGAFILAALLGLAWARLR